MKLGCNLTNTLEPSVDYLCNMHSWGYCMFWRMIQAGAQLIKSRLMGMKANYSNLLRYAPDCASLVEDAWDI